MQNRILSISGGILVLLGSLWLFDLSALWPLAIVATGGVFLLATLRYRIGALAIPGTILTGLGALLWGINLSGHWADWLYLWPTVPGLIGLGLFAASMLGMPGRRVRQIGALWIVQGILMTGVMWLVHLLMPATIAWTWMVIGLGIMFILTALLTGIGALAIPGTIIGGLGILLHWQNLTGLWTSWAYTWTLVPIFVGVGLVIANLLGTGSSTVRKVGLRMTAWGVVTLLILTFAFAFGELFARLWPILLIVAGLWIVQSALSEHEQASGGQ